MVKSDTVTLTVAPIPPEWPRVTVTSEPVKGVPVVVDGIRVDGTPVEFEVSPGTYTITVPATFNKGTFAKWEDESTAPIRAVEIIYDVNLIAYYEVPPPPARKFLPVVAAIAGGMAALFAGAALTKKKRG